MKQIDFSFFSSPDDDKRNTFSPEMIAAIERRKDSLLRVSLIELEGSLPIGETYIQHARLERKPETGEELIMWKGKPLLWFGPVTKEKIDGADAFNFDFKFLYNV
jgi:hypothetical protein